MAELGYENPFALCDEDEIFPDLGELSYQTMGMILHGAGCCGIKHIYALGANPKASTHALKAVKKMPTEANGYRTGKSKRFYPLEAPMESYEKRLERYLEYLLKVRKAGLVEIVLSRSYQIEWAKILTETHGFKLVTSFLNSNSGSWVDVYHLAFGQPEKKEDKSKNAFPIRVSE